jgi:hypothetical protein
MTSCSAALLGFTGQLVAEYLTRHSEGGEFMQFAVLAET